MSFLIFIAIVLSTLIALWMLIDSATYGNFRMRWALKALAAIAAVVAVLSRVGVV